MIDIRNTNKKISFTYSHSKSITDKRNFSFHLHNFYEIYLFLEGGVDYFIEDPYDFWGKEFKEYVFIKLRKRPIIEVTKADMVDLTGARVIDLKEFGIRPNKEKGSLEFFPNTGAFEALALVSSASVIFNNILSLLYICI